jgi:ATP:ADP antiporter, AAA family
MPFVNAETRPASPLRLLGAERDETAALGWSFLYFFALLTGYYVLRPVRDAMGAGGQLQWLFTGTFIAMLVVTPLYGAVVSRYPRRVFLPVVYAFFIACLVLFHVAFLRQEPWIGSVFFIWVAVFNLFAVSVFWSFMSDIFDNAQAKRLYGAIGAGGTTGALLGPTITTLLVGRIGVANLMLISAVLLGVCLICIVMLGPWARANEARRGARSGDEAMGGSVLAGFALLAKSRFLQAVALLTFFGVGVGTLLYNEQAAITRVLFPDVDERSAYYGAIDFAINALTLLLQLFVTRLLLTRYGVAPLLLAPAFVVLAGYSILAASPLPLMVAAVQVVTRAGNFGFIQPAKESLFTRVDRETRYKGKGFVDTVVYRGGDLSFVWFHTWLVQGLGFGPQGVFATGIAVVVGMAFGSWRLVRMADALPQATGEAQSMVRPP